MTQPSPPQPTHDDPETPVREPVADPLDTWPGWFRRIGVVVGWLGLFVLAVKSGEWLDGPMDLRSSVSEKLTSVGLVVCFFAGVLAWQGLALLGLIVGTLFRRKAGLERNARTSARLASWICWLLPPPIMALVGALAAWWSPGLALGLALPAYAGLGLGYGVAMFLLIRADPGFVVQATLELATLELADDQQAI